MKIFSKLFRMFLFVIIAPLFITAIFLFQYQKHAKKELLQNYLNIVETSAFALENNALNLTESLSNILVNKTINEQQEFLEKQTKEKNNILFLALFSPEGKEIARSKNYKFETLPLLDLSQNNLIKEIEKGEVKINYLEDLFPPYTTVITKQNDDNILLLVADFTDIMAQTEQHKIGQNGGLYFLDKDGYYLLGRGPLPLLNLTENSLKDKDTLSNLKTNANLILAGAYIKNPLGEGYLFLLQDQKTAFYTINLISWLIVFFVLATTTLSYFASLYFAEDLAEPMDKLIEAAHEITENNFDVNIDEHKYLKEFTPLIKTFNSMAVKLKEYQEIQLDKLLEERNKVNLLARLMRDGVVMCTLEGQELFTNKVAKYILGSEAFTKNIEATLNPLNVEGSLLKKLLKVPNGTVFHYTKENKEVYFEVISEIFHQQDEESVAIILFRDITSEHEISEMKNDVFNAVAHDLRAPILGIQGYVMLLEEGNLNEQEQQSMLKAISNSSKRLVSLVENILDISKLERGLLILKKTTFDLAVAVKDLTQSLLPLAEQKGLELKTDFANSLPIYADKNLIERMFSNLISNAIKFTSQGGVYISIKQDGKNYQITVHDTGVGISPEELPKIFKKYHQADRNVRGYGLGLTIVKQVAEVHQGTIEVNSELNKGTTFIINLPLNLEQERDI